MISFILRVQRKRAGRGSQGKVKDKDRNKDILLRIEMVWTYTEKWELGVG